MSTVNRTPNTRARRAALASFLGGTLEYYDFFIYATASSLVFSRIFFPEGDPTIALLQSFAIFGVGYIFRPLGGVLFGHLGDRIGRKNTLVLTLVLMGAATLLIGALPTYDTAGYLAPALLVILRIMQGLSAGGETAGASTLTLEESPVGRRSFFTSFTSSGINSGILLASFVFIPVAALPEEALLCWGWRVPFWLSAIVLVAAYFVRSKLDEPEVFADEKTEGKLNRLPLAAMLLTHPIPLIQVLLMSLIIVTNTFMQAFGLAFATQIGTVPAEVMLWASVVGNGAGALSQPVFGLLADKIGRKPVFAVGAAGSGVLIFVYFWSISVTNIPLVFLTSVVITGGTYAMANGIYPSWFAEQFNVRVRYTGLAVGLQIGILAAGFSPTIGTALVGGELANWLPAALVVAIACLLALVGALWARETYRTPLEDLGRPMG